MVEFRSLGSLTVLERGEIVSVGGQRQRRLLAMLLIHRDTVVSVDRLAEAVFAGEPTEAAGTTLRSYVARIRKSLGTADPEVSVVTQSPGYMLRVPSTQTDVGRFEHLLSDSQQLLALGEPAKAASSAREALALWSGAAYAEFADEDWARPESQRLSELRTVAEERLIEAELECGHHSDVIARLESLIEEHPLRESFRAQLMTALYRSGRQADALRAFRRYREELADEVGLDPSPALIDLERRILEHDLSLAPVEPAGEPLLGYRLGARLGAGPNGTIHAARLPGVDEEFLVHIQRGDRTDTADFVRSFDANARELARLRHPAVIPIHDWWREPGAAYVVSRRVQMRTLRDRLEQDRLSVDDLGRIVRRVGGALTVAADRGIRHGSVSIDTVLVDETERFFISDFDIIPEGPPDDVARFAETITECLHRLDVAADPRVGDLLRFDRSSEPDMRSLVDGILELLEPDAETHQIARPNPFKGLRPFDETDEGDFFGRDDLVAEFVRRLESEDPGSHLTLVVGGSGSGKSSVVRAGLLPRIRRGQIEGAAQWFATAMLPGSSPFKELVESLRRVAVNELEGADQDLLHGRTTLVDLVQSALPDAGTLLLIVDQFEEIFTLAPEHEQGAFLDCLADAVTDPRGRVRVLATLRADFYDRPLAFQRFGGLVDDATVAVAALSPAALESAIVGPVAAIGTEAEPALVAELVAAVADQPAALPSLQFTLFELAERRADRRLTLDDYRRLGGVDGAISSRAESLYISMDDAGRRAIRGVFERLVVIGPDGEVTGRRSARSSLSVGVLDDVVDDAIDRWTEARLLTTDHDPRTRVPTVQLAHEAILRSWPRLEQWLDEDRAAIITAGHVRDAAQSWHELDRDDGALYRGARLDQALEVADLGKVELGPLEQEFLAVSRDRRDDEERAALDHAERQARTNRRLRRQLAVIGVALVLALVVGVIALGQRRNADAQRSLAFARELAAAAEANVVDDPERSILLALEAIDASDDETPPEVVEALHRAVGASRIVLDVQGVGGRLAVSPLGNVFVTEGPEESGMIDLRSLETGESVRSWRGDEVDLNDVAFSSDGSMLAATGDDGSVSVWDPATGNELASFAGEGPAWYPRFSADGTRLSFVWPDVDLIEVVDPTNGTVVSRLPTMGDAPAELSPDGERLAVGSSEPPFAAVRDVTSGEVLVELEAPTEGAVLNVEWSPDGSSIAFGDTEGVLSIADAVTGERTAIGLGHTSGIVGIAWNLDGSVVATGSNDGTARLWDATSELLPEIQRFGAQDLSNGVPGVAFTPDGERLVVADWLVTATKIYDLRPEAASELAAFRAAPGSFSLAFTADGDVMANADDGTIAVHDAVTGAVERTHRADSAASGFVPSADGRFIALADEAGFPGTVIDAATDEVLSTFSASGWLDHAAWSPTGEHLSVAYGTADGSTIAILDRAGNELATIEQPGSFVPSTAFDATGTLLAVAKNGRTRFDPEQDRMEVWDWANGEIVDRLDVVGMLVVANPPNNTWIVSAFNDATLEVRDSASGELRVELAGHTGLIRDIATSNDGRRVATASNDRTVRIWDPDTGVELQTVAQDRGVVAVALDATGSRLATLDEEATVRIWALDADELTGIARTRVTRSFEDLECRQYLHVERCDDA